MDNSTLNTLSPERIQDINLHATLETLSRIDLRIRPLGDETHEVDPSVAYDLWDGRVWPHLGIHASLEQSTQQYPRFGPSTAELFGAPPEPPEPTGVTSRYLLHATREEITTALAGHVRSVAFVDRFVPGPNHDF